MKKYFIVLFLLVLSLCFVVGCGKEEPKKEAKIVVSSDEIELGLKEKLTIEYTVENGTESSNEFSTSDSSIAPIDEFGELQGKKVGSAVITIKVYLLDGSTITKDVNVKVVDNNEYTITFNLLGGTCDPAFAKVKAGTDYTLPIPTKEKAEFLGWSMTGVEGYITEIKGVSGNTTVRANWLNYYTLTYDLDGGTYKATSEDFPTGEKIELGIPTKEGYKFLGWSLIKGATTYQTALGGLSSDSTIYANWEPKQMDITFDLDGGVYTGARYVVFGGTLVLGEAKKFGAEFLGWSLEKGSTNYITKLENVTEEKVLYANWKSENYNINYVLDGGSLPAEAPATFVDGEKVTLVNPTKEGSTFIGWTTRNGSRTYITSFTGECEDKTLYANYIQGIVVGTTEYPTLTSAIAASSDGDTIYVLSGTYEGATIDKKITIKGANNGLNPNITTRGDETIFTTNLVVASSDVTIDGVTITGASTFTFGGSSNISNIKFLNCVVTNSTVNPDASMSNVAPFNLQMPAGLTATNVTVDKCRINPLNSGRPMIMMIDRIKDLTITNSYFLGGRYNYNDGVKTTDGANAISGNVLINGNYFSDYSQYVLWFRGFGDGKYEITNNIFKNIGQTAASHACANFVGYKGDGTGTVEIVMEANNIDNSLLLFRLDAQDKLNNTNTTVKLDNNIMTNCKGDFVVKNSDTDVTIDSKHSYYGVATVAASKFLNSTHSDDCALNEVLSYGAINNITRNIAYNLDNGTNPQGAQTTYVPGNEYVLPVPSKNGFAFVGWVDELGNEYEVIPATYNEDLALTAIWVESVAPTDFIITNIPANGIPYLDNLQLEWMFNPSNTYNKNLRFTSSNTSIFEVSETGYITTKKVGVATLKVDVLADSKLSQEIEIMVYTPGVFEISYETTSYVEIGKTIKLNATYVNRSDTEESLTWTSITPSIATVDLEGNVTGVASGLATIRATSSGEEADYFDFLVTVVSSDVSDAIKLVLNSHESNVFTRYNLNIGGSYNTDIIGSVSDINFGEALTINRDYEAKQAALSTNHGGPKTSTEFICVHYTGNMSSGTGGKMHASYFANGGGNTSIHYTTGNDGVYHILDDSLIGWHAGDGHDDDDFYWRPTGVMVEESDPEMPVWGITSDSYFTINGRKTNQVTPTGTKTGTVKVTGDTFKDGSGKEQPCINKMGLAYKIVNGEYYMGTTWWCYTQVSSGRICNKGGNMNSIGIESAVDKGSDLWYTWHKTAQLVANLMIENNLDITRVVGHHFYSAKNCPQPMLENDLEIWWKFKEMVANEYEKASKFNDYTFDFEILSGSENSNVRVSQDPKAKLVTYKVTVKNGTTTEEITLASAINGIYSK